MHFKRKIINQTWENGEKPNCGSDFGPFGPNLSPKKFFSGFYLLMLGIVASYHRIKFPGKLMIQTQENEEKKIILGLILARRGQIRATKLFLYN